MNGKERLFHFIQIVPGAEVMSRNAGVYLNIQSSIPLSSKYWFVLGAENAFKYNWEKETKEYVFRLRITPFFLRKRGKPRISLSYYIQYSNLYNLTPVNLSINFFFFQRRTVCKSTTWGKKKF